MSNWRRRASLIQISHLTLIACWSGDTIMKFIALHSRGGNYLVVASNVAWLRSAENGQTQVGIVGGQPLLVAGSMEEIAAQLATATVT